MIFICAYFKFLLRPELGLICSFHTDRHIKFYDLRTQIKSPVLLSFNVTTFTTAHAVHLAKQISMQVTTDTTEKTVQFQEVKNLRSTLCLATWMR